MKREPDLFLSYGHHPKSEGYFPSISRSECYSVCLVRNSGTVKATTAAATVTTPTHQTTDDGMYASRNSALAPPPPSPPSSSILNLNRRSRAERNCKKARRYVICESITGLSHSDGSSFITFFFYTKFSQVHSTAVTNTIFSSRSFLSIQEREFPYVSIL